MDTTTVKPPLAPEQIAAEIARRNKLFKGKTNAQKRVLIARDVLNLLKEQKIVANRASFVKNYKLSKMADEVRFYKTRTDEQLQPLLLQETCSCCALGSLMVSCTLFNNKEKVSDFYEHFTDLGYGLFLPAEDPKKSPTNGLAKIFSTEQLALIERTFEQGFNNGGFIKSSTALNNKYISDATEDKIKKFNPNVNEASKSRLIRIMRNIVKNKGTFKL